MQRGIAGSLIAVSLALTACADQQGWLNGGAPTAGYGADYGYGYAPYPPGGGLIVGGFGSDYDRWYRNGDWRREHPNWSQADAQRYWQLQQQKAQNEAVYRQRALQWEQQQRENQAVYQQRALQWDQQQKKQQAQRQWQLMQQEWKRQHPGQ
jgi:hypothetical protein